VKGRERRGPPLEVERENGTEIVDLDELIRRPYNNLRRWIRVALALGVVATGGVIYLAFQSGDQGTRHATTTAGATGTAVATAADGRSAGRRVVMQRVVKNAPVSGVATVKRATTKRNVVLQIDLDLHGGRGTVALRSPTRGLHYMYDALGSGTQTTTWSRKTLRRYRSLVVIGHRRNIQRPILVAPTYKLLGGKKPPTNTVRRLPIHPAAESNLHRLLLERTRDTRRSACYLRRSDRPATATAQWACRVEGVPVRYLRFRTKKSMRNYAGWLASTTASQPTPNTPICPDGTVGWSKVTHNRRASGTVRLRRRPAGGLLLIITYSSRRSLAVAGAPTAINPAKVCRVWWRAA
jgi:hypothetical protein